MYFWVSSKLYYKHALPQKGQHKKKSKTLNGFYGILDAFISEFPPLFHPIQPLCGWQLDMKSFAVLYRR